MGESTWCHWLAGLSRLARVAGRAILDIRASGMDVEHKDDMSPVTRADRASERIILDGLAALSPEIPVISEERAVPPWPVRRQWPTLWLVDPLDGTREFVAGRDSFVINIALVIAGSPVLGLIHQPATDRTVAACQKSREGSQWCCSLQTGAETPVELTPGLGGMDVSGPLRVVVSEHYGDRDIALLPERLKQLYPQRRVERVGGALKFCLLATGQADYYVRGSPTCEWDTAAGQAILEAVGGGIRDFAGARFNYNRRESLLNPGFHAFGPRLAGLDWLDT